MARALALASRCAGSGDVPVGAVLVRDGDGEVLAEAWVRGVREGEWKSRQAKTSPLNICVLYSIPHASQNRREAEQKPLSHAETLAINEAAESLGSWRLDSAGEVSLYVTLEPCLMCYGAAALARVGRIVYAARSDKGGALVGGACLFPSFSSVAGNSRLILS